MRWMLAALLAMAVNTAERPATIVDLAEINKVYDENEPDKLLFTQIVVWRWGYYPQGDGTFEWEYHVSDWCCVREWEVRRRSGFYLVRWTKVFGRKRHAVLARHFRHPRATTVDHERRDQDEWPAHARRPFLDLNDPLSDCQCDECEARRWD